jgi:hypothetical protein
MQRHRFPTPHAFGLTVGLSLAAASAWAGLGQIAWGPAGTHEQTFSVGPKEPHEVCGRLDAGTRVRWRFESDQPTDFNIHHHVGQDVFFAAQEDGSRAAAGRFEAKETQDYCWMWSRKAGPAAAVRLRLERER